MFVARNFADRRGTIHIGWDVIMFLASVFKKRWVILFVCWAMIFVARVCGMVMGCR